MADEKLKVAGIKLKIDGAATFSDNLNKINSRLKTNSAELKKVSAQYQDNEKSIEGLTAKQKALQNSLDTQKKKTTELKDVLAEAVEEYGENSKEVERLKSAIADSEAKEASFEAQLRQTNDQLNEQTKSLNNTGKELQQAGEKIEKFGDKTAKVGGKLTTGLTLPIAALGTGAVAAFNEIDDGYDIIIKKTGATGEALNDLNRVAENVYTSMPVNMDDVGNAVGELNTRFDINGDVLEDATRKSLEFARVNDADVTSSIRNVSRYMGDAGIDASQYGSVLDTLTVAGQKTGISMDKLTEYLAKYGAPMRALGFETRESIALFSQWEKSGVNVEIAFSGMKKAISTWAKDGKDSREEFKKTLDEIKACPDIAAATTKAIEVFGTKAGPDLADAIKGGRFEYTELLNVIENSAGALDSTYESLLDGADDTAVAINKGKNALSKLGETVLNSAAPVIEDLSEIIKKASAWFNNLSDSEKKAVVKTLAFVAAAGPVVSIGGKIIKTGGSIVKTVGKMTSFFTKGGKAAADMADGTQAVAGGAKAAAGGTKALSGALSLSNPVLLAAAAVVGALTFAYAASKKEQEKFAESASRIPEAMSNYQNMVSSATSVLSGFNAESKLSNDELSKIDKSIEKAQKNIIDIAETAAAESRAITDSERAEIQELIGMIDSYTSKKLEAYQEQQGIVRAMVENETNMTTEAAAQYQASAEQAYNDMLNKAQELRLKAYADANGNKDLEKAADEAFNTAKNDALKTYGETLSGITEKYYAQNVAVDEGAQKIIEYREKIQELEDELDEIEARPDTDFYKITDMEDTLAEIDEAKEGLKNAISDLDEDSVAIVGAWMSMAAETEIYGGQISKEASEMVSGICESIENLPKDVKKTFTDAMDGALKGLKEKESTLYAKATSIANGVIARMNKALEINSPSRVTRRMFQGVDEGAIYGLKDKEQELYSQGEKLGVGTAAAISRGYSSKAVNIGTLNDLYPTVNRAGAAYSSSRTYNSTYSNDTYDSGIHIGTLNVNGASGTGNLISELETIEYARREQARSRGER